MSNQIVSLLVILVLTLPVFLLAQAPASALAMPRAEFAQRRNIWILLTLLAFLAPNFWVCAVGAVCLLALSARRGGHVLGRYCFLLFVIPAIGVKLPGFGIVNYLISVDHLRLLALVLLLPACFTATLAVGPARAPRHAADKFILGYFVLALILQLPYDTLTNSLRTIVGYGIDILPYLAASRLVRKPADFEDILMSFSVAALLMAPLAVYEMLRGHLLYNALNASLGEWGFGNYLLRGETLRALVSLGQPIILGYVMMVALGCFLHFRGALKKPVPFRLGVLALVCGLIVTLSRGPWIGAVVVLLCYIMLGPQPLKSFARFCGLVLVLTPLLLLTPVGKQVIDYLPFVGTVGEENVDYRQDLIKVSFDLIKRNPWFGSFDYMNTEEMQSMRQGEGIIDIVNTYIGVALTYGVVGLFLFVGAFAAALWGLWKRLRHLQDKQSPLYRIGQTLFAVCLGCAVTIATVSNIIVIPAINWLFIGLSMAWVALADKELAAQASGAACVDQVRA